MTKTEQPSAKNAKPTERRRLIKKWGRYGAYGIAGIVLGTAGVVGLAGTGPILRLATPFINETVSLATDSKFEIGDVEGSLWTGLTLDHLVMDRASDGFHFDLTEAVFDWSPLALFTGRLQINQIGLASANIILPDGTVSEEPEEEETNEGGGFSLPLAVSIDALELGEIAVVDPASGHSFLYTLSGQAAVGKNLSATAVLDLQPRDSGTDRLAVDLDFDGPAQRLSAKIDGELGRDGIVMTLAGLGPDVATDIKISLAGDGPANDWQGKLDLAADGYAALVSDIGVQLSSETVGFSLDGGLETFERITDTLPEALRQKIDLGVTGAFNNAQQSLTFDRLSVAMAGAADLTGTASLDLEKSQLAGDVDANIDPALSALMDDAVTWGQLGVSIQAKGDLAMPGLDVAINAKDVKTPVSTISGVLVSANMPAPSSDDSDIEASLDVSTTGSIWDDGDLAAFLGDTQELSLKTVIASDFSQIAVSDLVLNAPEMTLRGNAELDEAFAVSDAKLVGDVADLSIFAPISGLDLRGQGQVVLGNLSWSEEAGAKADIAISTTETGFGIADLDRIVGPAPTITGTVALLPNLDLAIDLAAVDTAMVKGPVKVDITDEFERLMVKGDFDIAPGVVPPGIGVSIAPSTLSVLLDGNIAEPPGQIDLRVPSLEAGGQSFDDVRLATKMEWSKQSVLSLINKVRFSLSGRSYDLAANVVLPSDGLKVEGITLRGDHLNLEGEIALPNYEPPLRGKIALTNLDAEMLADFGVPLANGTVTADVGFTPDGARQTVTLSALAKGLRMAGETDANPVMIEDVQITASVGNAFDTPEISAKLDGQDIVADALAIKGITLDVQGGLDALGISLTGDGVYQGNVPLKTDLAAEIALGSDISVMANKFDVAIGDQTIALRKPLQVVLAEDGRQQVLADLKIGSGNLMATLDQEAGQKSIAGDVALSDVDLGPWGRIAGFDGLSGIANLSASLRETKGSLPTANVKGQITGITAKAVKGIKPFEMILDLDLGDGSMVGSASLGNSDAKILSADGTVPLPISVLQQEFSPDLTAPVSGKVRIDGEIAEFWPYVPAPDHVVSGNINLALDVGGTLDDIEWKGDVALADGHYENLVYGTILEQMTLKGEFDQNGLSIPGITATDGGNGRVTASVDLEIKDGGELAYDVAAKLNNVAVSRKDELLFWADVDTTVTGNQNAADIKSTVTVQRGEVDLTLALPESVPTIEVANLPTAEEKKKAEEAEEEGSQFTGNLDVTVNVPGRLFVRGKGLDSEWGGRLEITGTTDEPIIVGQLSALRGQLDIIGKTFVIKDSKITFAGGSPPDPMLDIKGVYTTDDLEVSAGFQGPASDPELVLTSNPSLPEDEILSQVLFGKSQGSLSAVEAVQLASALNELSGGGSGLDVVGSVRRFIGADVLQVGGGEDGPEVKVGKYLADGVYVGTKAGATPGSSGVEVEIEVTPSISVTSETTEIDSKAGVQYRLDY
ncbi:translocation/assembly module TamB domain-containing protein [Thalassospira lucentensis]|uniref:translocation/assembly module TamB domain-containing protein n=1 Tax=Thalassospira lucentensis TaxID=168935 RepID=UPI003D2EA662